MSKYQVTKAELQSVINELKTQNQDFKTRVTELQSAQQELGSQWQGEANTAFNTAFQNDAGQWTSFANLVDQYIEALTTIMTTYELAEDVNTATARVRSY